MAYLITGGAGFIGSHVAQRLIAEGQRVVIFDNFNDYYDPALKRANVARLQALGDVVVVEGDVRDVDTVNATFDAYGITHVAHLAAMAGVRFSVNQVPLYVAVNLNGTMNLLEASVRHRVAMFLLASTSSVYGETKHLPFTETDSADRPLAAYPASKRAAELLAHTYHHLHGMNVNVLRFFNVYGPNGRPDMMPLKLLSAVYDGSEVKLFNDGDIARDWTYIDDTTDGVLAALARPMGYEVMNLGVGKPISMREFVHIIEELSGRRVNAVAVPTPLSDPPITFCNNQKARDLLGFAPKVEVFEGLRRTWEWFVRANGL